MAHFAKLDNNNIVIDVCVVNNDVITVNGVESELEGISFLKSITGHDKWAQTSYNSNFRKNYASSGYSYDATLDAFIPPKPYASWILNESICDWNPPVAKPNDGNTYIWNESTFSWILQS